MNYEKKYKEALERAKKLHDSYNLMHISVDEIEQIFPELAESEDERIRKAIIHYILYETKGAISEATEHTWVKWLEKQKEQKPVEIHLDNPNIQKHDPDVKITTSDSSAGGDELLYVCNKSYNIGFRDGVNSVAPAEWGQSRLTVEDIKTILDLSFWNDDPEKILEEYNRICDTSKVTPR